MATQQYRLKGLANLSIADGQMQEVCVISNQSLTGCDNRRGPSAWRPMFMIMTDAPDTKQQKLTD